MEQNLLKIDFTERHTFFKETELLFLQFCLQSYLVSLLLVTTILNHLWTYLLKVQGGLLF